MSDNDNLLVEKEIFKDDALSAMSGDVLGYVGLVPWLAGAGETIPAWWSSARDMELRRFVKSEDHLAGTVYTLRDMLTTIPKKVLPRDTTVKAHWKAAAYFTDLLEYQFESRGNTSAGGWDVGFGAGVEDYYTQDNGWFTAIEGPGRPDGPLTGAPTKLIHLDSYRVQRTGNRDYPVIYTDLDGKRYRLHQSRVIAITMSSPIAEMLGVGFCSVSRAIHAAQSLIDNARYKEEKLGSRPRRAMMIGKGFGRKDVEAVSSAMHLSSEGMDNAGLTRYSTIPLIGIGKENDISLLDLASLPDGFNNLEDTQLGMAVLALAFGVTSRQLAFALGVSGETKADAEVQNINMMGKGPTALLQKVVRSFERMVLPPYLKLVFDYQDDTQDEMVSRIRKTRAETREKDLSAGAISVRVAREQMVETGDLTNEQFIQLELDDGRLEDGLPLDALFTSPDAQIKDMLGAITRESLQEEIDAQAEEVRARLQTAPNAALRRKAQAVLALLLSLKPREAEPAMKPTPESEPVEMSQDEAQPIEETAEEQPADESELTVNV